jgi:uncharacterized Zn finger protein
MSADNWTYCPKCIEEDEKKHETLKQKANDSYGKINPDEYIKLIEELNKMHLATPKETLAEYFEMGILKKEFFIRYSAHCTKCGFEYKYNLDKKL